ncbi:ATP-binding protein [Pseudalkalibacillus hwajinpoensis]|uniref:histidine kinase n=1 Tax=Guptibacillus hwajinpoensis TaxID=208199 RepID=A0A4U1MET0_9BACL|nr:ATP-binding protein [Pseudalkalibacillus hwajinpoensis]TKD68842.1 GHKL domain-containing protein [Pseudalkalibacillus hwajinpoensis]
MEKRNELATSNIDLIFHHLSDLIFQIRVVDVHHYEIEAVNEAYLSNYETSKDDLSGKRVEEFLGVDQGLQAIRRFQEAIFHQEPIHFEEGYSFPKQGYRVFDITLVPIVEGGTVSRLIGAAKDITEKRLSEEQIAQSEKLSVVGQLAAGIAHELRNPLTSLKGFLKLIDYKNTNTEVDRYIQVMNSEFQRIEQIIDEFLILAKPTKSNFTYERIDQLLDEVIELLNGQANMKSIILKKNYSSTLSHVYGERNQLKQVIINIIKNALEAISEGNSNGEIRIEAKEIQNKIIVSIQDNGKGIPEQELEKLGSPFFTTKKDGTGLGLAICKRIIGRHNGELEITSQHGEGTRITITLPKCPSH